MKMCGGSVSKLGVWRFGHHPNRPPPDDRGTIVCTHADCRRGMRSIPSLLPRKLAGRVVWQVILILSFSLLCALMPGPLKAQDPPTSTSLIGMSLEDLMKVDIDSVYGASGYKQKVTEAPASVTIITSDDIRKYGYRTLAEILSNAPGFYISYDRNYSFLGIRGFGRPGDYNSRILLLVDGHRLNDSVYDQAFIGTEFPLDVDLIDRVEVIRGPNSSLYVASAFLGVINVITKRAHNSRDVTASACSPRAGSSIGNRSPSPPDRAANSPP